MTRGKAPANVRREGIVVDRAKGHRPSQAVKRLIPIGEDLAQQVLATPQEHVRNFALLLEDRAHQTWQRRVERQDFLKLVEDYYHTAFRIERNRLRHTQEVLDRGVEVNGWCAAGELEGGRAVSAQRDPGAYAELAEPLGRALHGLCATT